MAKIYFPQRHIKRTLDSERCTVQHLYKSFKYRSNANRYVDQNNRRMEILQNKLKKLFSKLQLEALMTNVFDYLNKHFFSKYMMDSQERLRTVMVDYLILLHVL
jgi:hypothetical protein